MTEVSPENKRAHKTGQSSAHRFTMAFVVSIAAVTGILGFIAGTRSDELMSVLTPSGFGIQTGSLDLDPVQQTYRTLRAKYDGDLDQNKLVNYASKGLAEATGDPYTTFFTAEEAKKLDDDLSGRIGGGIGAEMGRRNGKVVILRTLKDTPAAASGLQTGDIVIGVNDESVIGEDVDTVVQKIRGEVDTTVKIVVQRGEDHKEFSIKRAEITSPDVESKVQDGVGVITVSRFDRETGVKVRAAATDFKKQGVKGVVLDLRGNGGGFLDSGVETASVWLGDKTVVTERRGGKVTQTLKSKGTPVLNGVPTVVLIDSGSASASEIVAGALHDHGAATLIGEKSFGKGSVQEIVPFADGSQLKVTVARWYTPNGKNINKEGISPDKKVELSATDVNANRDPQLDAALQKLSGE